MDASETDFIERSTTSPAEQELRLTRNTMISIGSAPDNDLGVGNPALAEHHARIVYRDGRLHLSDLGNDDVLVNAVAVNDAWLVPGDVVHIGRMRLTIGEGVIRYRDPTNAFVIGQRRGRVIPDALLNNMSGFSGVPSEPAKPLPNLADVSRPAVFAVLRRRNFLLLWLAQLISEMGGAFTTVAASILIYRLTGSALHVGLLMIATALPSLFIGLIAGVFVDRWDRRRTMIIADLLRFGLIVMLPLAASFSIIWLYVIVIVSSAIGQFFNPAHASLLPDTAPDDELAAANALMAISAFGSMSVGFAASGLIAAFFSIEWTFYLDALTFVISAFCISQMKLAPFVTASEASIRAVGRELRAGMRFLVGVPSLRSIFLIYIPIFTLFGLVNTLLLPFTLRVLNGTEFDYGLLLALESVGLVCGSLLIARVTNKLHEGQWITLSFLGMGLTGMAFSLAPTVAIAMAFVTLQGALNAPSVVARQLVIQRNTPRELRGRVNSAFFVTRDTVFLFGMAASGLADLFSPRLLSLISWLIVLACGFLALVLPGLRQPFAAWRHVIFIGRSLPHSSQERN